MRKDLVLCALSLGYGPVSKLISIAECLRERNVPSIFLGTGIAYELAARSTPFKDIVHASASDRAAHSLIRASRRVVSFMDVEIAKLAFDVSVPIDVVDSLVWMRNTVPSPFKRAERYWVQNFPGVPPHISTMSPKPTLVGPIVSPRPSSWNRKSQGLLINLGGYSSPYFDDGDLGYGSFVLNAILQSGLLNQYPGKVSVIAGASCIGKLENQYHDRGLTFASVSHTRALRMISQASMILTAPGLTATLECFGYGRPTLLLPPQNYSQWWILKKLRAVRLAPCSFHWEDCLEHSPVSEGMSMEQRVPVMREIIKTVSSSTEAKKRYRELLGSVALLDLDLVTKNQTDFFKSLGRNGVEQIADALATESVG